MTLPAHFRRWSYWRRWFGRRSEKAAARFLAKLGWPVVAANWADQLGEIDLLAVDGKTLVVVEVRSTSTADPNLPAASVDYRKQKKLTEAAVRFLSRRRLLGVNLRFDVLAIAWPLAQREPTIVHHRHAFDPTGKFQMFS